MHALLLRHCLILIYVEDLTFIYDGGGHKLELLTVLDYFVSKFNVVLQW